ncbi:hypothetical protein KA082_00080 [Candidatus Woesebacteria bacterium]|nr:hypothetical protein [Candidatus Woesebacteria bacterium]
MQEIIRHRTAYIVLLLLLSGSIFFIIQFRTDPFNQRLCIGATAVLYFLWGIVTHVKTQCLTRYVVAEYAGIALLGALFLLVLTF